MSWEKDRIEGAFSVEFRRQFENHPIHNRIELLDRFPAFRAVHKMFAQFFCFGLIEASRSGESAEFKNFSWCGPRRTGSSRLSFPSNMLVFELARHPSRRKNYLETRTICGGCLPDRATRESLRTLPLFCMCVSTPLSSCPQLRTPYI